jgi:hypothetical protein
VKHARSNHDFAKTVKNATAKTTKNPPRHAALRRMSFAEARARRIFALDPCVVRYGDLARSDFYAVGEAPIGLRRL